MIGRRHHLIIDCPDPEALAAFYSQLLGQPITYRSVDFVVVADNTVTSGLAFQLAPDYQPPAWPDPDRPQQMHLDVMVDDVAAAGQSPESYVNEIASRTRLVVYSSDVAGSKRRSVLNRARASSGRAAPRTVRAVQPLAW